MKGGQAIRKYYEIPSEPEDYTGGYIITSIQPTFYVNEASGFITARGYHFTFQQPKYVTKAQIDYASALYQSIEDALFSADGIDPATGKHFSEIVDMNSFVNRYLQAEVTNDNDSQFFYTYKDSDSVDPIVYFGPVWDQDNTFGISVLTARAQKLRMKNDQSASYYWFTRATKHDFFNNQLITTYNEIYAPALDILLGNAVDPKGRLKSIDEYAEAIRSSAECDLIRYTLTNRKTYWSNMQTSMGGTYEGNLNYLKKFISERKQALDAAYSPDNLVW